MARKGKSKRRGAQDAVALAQASAKNAAKSVTGPPAAAAAAAAAAEKKVPRSMVVRHGNVGRNISLLVADLRAVMNPHTANELKERRGASVKDYVAFAPAFSVSHLLVVTQGSKAPNLRVARLPQGPTLTFRVERYALSRQIRKVQKRTYDVKGALTDPPLVVLNNFDEGVVSEKRHLKIASLVFQSMFPAINVRTVKLASCKRVLLVHLNEDDGTIELRHYLVRSRLHGVNKTVRRVIESKVPNLGNAEDISEILTAHAGYATSDSEMDEDAKVDVRPSSVRPSKSAVRKQVVPTTKSVIKLVEIGPRMTLRVVKVEDGVFGGEVQYHAFKERSKEEIKLMRERHREKRELKEKRRAEQDENVKRKRAVEQEKIDKKKAKRQRRAERQAAEGVADASDKEEGGSEGDSEDNVAGGGADSDNNEADGGADLDTEP